MDFGLNRSQANGFLTYAHRRSDMAGAYVRAHAEDGFGGGLHLRPRAGANPKLFASV